MRKPIGSRFALGCIAIVGVAGCPNVGVDKNEGPDSVPPTVEFDPLKSIVPFPNNLVIDQTTKRVNLPPQLCESATAKAVRENVVNKLDGFGTYEAGMTVTFTTMPDMASVTDHVVLYEKTTPLTPIPTVIVPTVTARFADANSCATPTLVPTLAIVPAIPLKQNTTYDVAVLDGLTTGGQPYAPSGTWMLVRSKADPVTLDGTDAAGNPIVTVNNTPLDPTDMAQLAQIVGIDRLWKAHASLLDALDGAGHARPSVLLAWELTTATVTDPIDPKVAGSIAAGLSDVGFAGFAFPPGSGVTTSGQGEQLLVGFLGKPECDLIGCKNVGDVFGAQFGSYQFQQPVTNPLAGGAPVPGAWNDPVHPTVPQATGITTFIITPKGPVPPGGWPTVIFGHGLGSSKETLAVFGPQLAGAGFASVAIDFVDHGSRAVRTRDDAECAGNPDPTKLQQCFALFLSTDLAATRDNFRQTILDLQRLDKALVTCSGATGCAGPADIVFKVDASKIVYAGISLGGIIGSTFVSVTPNVKTAVLNVPGVGLLDILENTANIGIRCTLVNALIDAQIVSGDKWTGGATGLCVAADQGWKTQPGYQQFSSIARWVLDPADGANYVGTRLPAKKFLIQEVVGDQVVPNIATDREAALVGFAAPAIGDLQPIDVLPPSMGGTSATPVASAAITANLASSKWLRYPPVPAAGDTFPGNDFQHASLLAPVSDANGPTLGGILGTIRVQTDAVTFLYANQ